MPVARKFYYYHKHKLPKHDYHRFYLYCSTESHKKLTKVLKATYTAVRFIVENFWSIYPDTLDRLRGKFSLAELLFLADHCKRMNISYIGNFQKNMDSFFADLPFSYQDYKGKPLDPQLLTSKLEELARFELCCLQICTMVYNLLWRDHKKPKIETYFKKHLL